MAHRKEFYLYKRHKKGGDYWYVCFLDRTTGKQMSAKSIDCLKERLGILDFKSVVEREEALLIAQKALDRKIVDFKKKTKTFASYCLDFWSWERSEYIALRNSIKKGSIGKEYAYNMEKNFKKNILPLLPENLDIKDVKTSDLDKIIRSLYKKNLSHSTICILISSFTLPLKEAKREGLIDTNPCDNLLKVSREQDRRGVLTKIEVEKLIKKLKEMKNQIFPSYYYGITLALITGMRSAEIRSLRVDDILDSGHNDYKKLVIKHSLAYLSGVKSTKSGYERFCLIPSSLAKELINNASPSGLLLPSPFKKKEYISPPTFRNVFYSLLSAIGIDEEERRKRKLSFHSLRHTFSTICLGYSVSQEDRMLIMGHQSQKVNEMYTHSSDEAVYRATLLIKQLFTLF